MASRLKNTTSAAREFGPDRSCIMRPPQCSIIATQLTAFSGSRLFTRWMLAICGLTSVRSL